MPTWRQIVSFIYARVAARLYFYACVVLNSEFYLYLCGDKFMPVWQQVCSFLPVWL